MLKSGIIALSLLLVGVAWSQDVQVPSGLTFPSQNGQNSMGIQNGASLPGFASDPFASSSSVGSNSGFNFASNTADFPSIGAASGANNPDFPTLGISSGVSNDANSPFPTIGGNAASSFSSQSNGFPQAAGPMVGGQGQLQSWTNGQSGNSMQTNPVTLPGMGPTQPVNSLFPGPQNASPFGTPNAPNQMSGFAGMNSGMNQGMNSGMNQGMSPGMNPSMTSGMTPGMNPSMTPGMNPGMTPRMNQGMFPSAGFGQPGQQVNAGGMPQQNFQGLPQPGVPGFNQPGMPGSPMFNAGGQQGMQSGMQQGTPQSGMSVPNQPQVTGLNANQGSQAQGTNQMGFQQGTGTMMNQGQGSQMPGSMGMMGNTGMQVGGQGMNSIRGNMGGFNINPNLPPRELRCHQETCPMGTQCTLYDPRGDFMCPRWIPVLPCTCRPGCQVENLFIRAGMRRNVDRCGSFCDCDVNGQANCTYFQCPGGSQDQQNQQTQNQQPGK